MGTEWGREGHDLGFLARRKEGDAFQKEEAGTEDQVWKEYTRTKSFSECVAIWFS